MTDAFFVPENDLYVGTAATGGPWDARRTMHFGPPAALLARCIEAQPSRTPKRVARVTFDILRPVPIGPVRVDADIVRPGGRIDLVAARLLDRDGVELALARAWRIRTEDTAVDAGGVDLSPPLGPEHGHVKDFFVVDADDHYGTSVETRFVSGSFLDPGPAVVWMRQRMPLLAGEAPSPLCRVLTVADSGNGVSAVADPRSVLFVNTDLTVHLHREAVGEWICLQAETVLDRLGSGLTTTRLADRTGAIGMSLQTLFVQRRS